MKILHLKKQIYSKKIKISKISIKNVKLSLKLGYITLNNLKKIIYYNIIILLQKNGLILSKALRKVILKLLKKNLGEMVESVYYV